MPKAKNWKLKFACLEQWMAQLKKESRQKHVSTAQPEKQYNNYRISKQNRNYKRK
jgi:hypothetical protein